MHFMGPVRGVAIMAVFALITFGQTLELETQAKGVLEKRCWGCHDAKLKTSGLDLSSRTSALTGGSKGPALKPGAPDQSLLWERIDKNQMPLNSPLPAAEREIVMRLIEPAPPCT